MSVNCTPYDGLPSPSSTIEHKQPDRASGRFPPRKPLEPWASAPRLTIPKQNLIIFFIWYLPLLPSSVTNAAEPKIQVDAQGPHFVGRPSTIQIYVQGFDQDTPPEISVRSVAKGLKFNYLGANRPRVEQSLRIINGRRYESITVTYSFVYQAGAQRPGEFTVGPFLVQQGEKKISHRPIKLRFREMEEDEDMRIVLEVPNRPVYLGERFPVTIEWWYAGDVRNVRNLAIRSSIFDQFRFIDEEPSQGDQQLPIQTEMGEMRLKGTLLKKEFQGRRHVVIAATRQLLPEKPGDYEIPPITATMNKVKTWRRDFFGGRVADRAVPVQASGNGVLLRVKPLPLKGRPDSFAGAVGNGFSLDVTADRSVVRVGDPIGLTLRVLGGGNLEVAGLPPLFADGGMSPDQFRLPNEDVAGIFSDGVKTFQVSVRVQDETVDEIPALAFSWFNPETESYETTRSKPIALRVDEAHVVTASDVESHAPRVRSNARKSDPAAPDSISSDDVVESGEDGAVLALSGADLAIEQDPHTLLIDARRPWGGNLIPTTFYGAGILLIALALVDRRLKQVDPEVVRRRKSLRTHHRRLESAAGMPRGQAVKQIADALRAIVAEVPDADRTEVETILSQCENLIYAPGTEKRDAIDPLFVERAVASSRAIIKEDE